MRPGSIIRNILLLLLTAGLSACLGQIPSAVKATDSSRPSRWVTKTWVEGENEPKGIQNVVRPTEPNKSWLAGNFINPFASTGNLWDRLPSGFQLPDASDNRLVQAQISWFLTHQGFLMRTTNRAAPFMYYIYQQVHRRNLPTELVMLPIIESAYNPFINSSKGAAGIWQMMPGTASTWGIKQNWWYDGRRDIFASTNAALDYLTYLQNYFNGNWLLAIAAYNCGEGCVQNAIRNNARLGRATDFWSLPLPAETRAYVPRLLALATMVKNRGTYPIVFPVIQDKPYLTQIDVGSQIDLALAARLAGMSLQELRILNPGYNHSATDPNGMSHLLIMPITKIDAFKQNLAALPSIERISFQRYKVKHGDKLSRIAERFNTSENKLLQINNLTRHALKPGKTILVPVAATKASNYNPVVKEVSNAIERIETSAKTQPNLINSSFTSYDPQQSFANSVAQQAITSQAVTNTNVVNKTQTITEQVTNTDEEEEDENQETNTKIKEAVKTTEATSNHYIVKSGDTLHSIALKYGVTTNELIQANRLKNSTLRLGATLVIPNKTSKKIAPVQKNKHQATTYTVRPGDTLFSIARHHGISVNKLQRLNRLPSSAQLKPGRKLIINP